MIQFKDAKKLIEKIDSICETLRVIRKNLTIPSEEYNKTMDLMIELTDLMIYIDKNTVPFEPPYTVTKD